MNNTMITAKQLLLFETELKENEKSQATIEKYLRDVRLFAAYIEDRKIDKNLVLEFKSHLAESYAPASANSMLVALNSFLRFVGRSDCCVKQFKVQRKSFCPEEEELTKAEYMRLIKTAEKENNERISLVIQTLCGTGIRVSELRYITTEAVRHGETTVTCKGKTRTIFIVSALRKKLLCYAEKNHIVSGAIFITKNGNPLNRSNIWREMKALCEDAGVSPNKVFPHNLRHLFARVFYGIEKDIAKLADILGHSSINTTRIYIMTSGIEHRQRMERMRLII